ncbi:MAG: tetratricopeptide repeat protein [Bacteroidetes bacterium]|nr:MAG: tetratricopeptide repeat protein [Bacteroidota bacterium]
MRVITFSFLVVLGNLGFAQNFQDQFKEYSRAKDTTKQLETLKAWELNKPSDPEFFTSAFNFYFSLCQEEFVTINPDRPNGEALEISDSTGTPVGFLGSQIIYNLGVLQQGLNKIDQGIKLHPNRLDMRFGKIYVLGEISDWDNFTSEVIKTIHRSSKNNNEWTWTNNQARDDGQDFFLSSIQTYQNQLFNTENDSLLYNMRDIAFAILEHYPDHIESLSNISITYLVLNEYEKGLKPLLKAEKLDNTDIVVLSNIARAYILMKNEPKALEYYNKMIQYGNDNDKRFAEARINELKKTK